jgi:PKD repeat protein
VTLAGNDGAGGSGVDKTEYKVDGGAFAAYTAPIAVTTPGSHTIEFRSTDKAGNVEATKSLTVKVDKAAPATTAALEPGTPGAGGTYTGTVGLTLTATDPVSGVAKTEYMVNTPAAFGAFGAPKLAAAAAEWVTYDPASKPSFTAPGAYSIDYRSTDAAGNVETAKTVSFTIAGADDTAPVTTGTLEPAQPGPGGKYSVPVKVKLSAADPAPQGPAPATVDVEASGDRWSKDSVALTNGDKITWHFGEAAVFPHDVWVLRPGGNPNPNGGDLEQVTSGIVFPGADPVSKTFTQNGAWTFLCKVHSTYSGGTWTGMVGTAAVSPASGGDAPSGVDYTEYRVKTGATQGDWVKKANTGGASPFDNTVTVSEQGDHTVEYRSVDKAGNVEATKSIAFSIATPANQAPTVQIAAAPRSGTAPLTVEFSSDARDPEGAQLKYAWSFGDGGTADTPTAKHVYTQPGAYTATLTVTDPDGASSTATVEVVVSTTPPATQPPGGGGDGNPPAPKPKPWFGVGKPPATPLATFTRRGLAVRITCSEAMSGSATLTLSSAVKRKLRLKSATLARSSVKCGGPGSKTVTLKPSKTVKRALAAARGSHGDAQAPLTAAQAAGRDGVTCRPAACGCSVLGMDAGDLCRKWCRSRSATRLSCRKPSVMNGAFA